MRPPTTHPRSRASFSGRRSLAACQVASASARTWWRYSRNWKRRRTSCRRFSRSSKNAKRRRPLVGCFCGFWNRMASYVEFVLQRLSTNALLQFCDSCAVVYFFNRCRSDGVTAKCTWQKWLLPICSKMCLNHFSFSTWRYRWSRWCWCTKCGTREPAVWQWDLHEFDTVAGATRTESIQAWILRRPIQCCVPPRRWRPRPQGGAPVWRRPHRRRGQCMLLIRASVHLLNRRSARLTLSDWPPCALIYFCITIIIRFDSFFDSMRPWRICTSSACCLSAAALDCGALFFVSFFRSPLEN